MKATTHFAMLTLGLTIFSGCSVPSEEKEAKTLVPSDTAEDGEQGTEEGENEEEKGEEVTCDNTLDTDDDGLSECDEELYGTSPVLADTDGDGYSDGREVLELGFSAENNNFKFNPLIADTPRLRVEFVSAPAIGVHAQTSTGATSTHEITRSEESKSSIANSQSSSNSRAVELTVTQGASVTVGAEVSLFSFGASAEATVSYEQSESTTQETSMSWSEEQRSENAQGLAQAQAEAQSEEQTLTGGQIQVAVDIINEGHLAYTLSNITLTAVLNAPRGESLLTPLGTLAYDTTVVQFPEVSIGPSSSRGPYVFEKPDLLLSQTEHLLKDSSSLDIRIAGYEVRDPDGRSFTHSQTEIQSRTATVIIDYDGEDVPYQSERFQVATNVDRTRLRVDALNVLEQILRIPHTLSADGDLISVRGVETSEENNAAWTVVHKSSDGVLEEVRILSSAESTSLAELELKSGDILHLVYIEDRDRDGVGRRQELAMGTDPSLPDSDGDGLEDGVEVWQFNTDPTLYDTDVDGLSDGQEVVGLETNPLKIDSDDDGIWDPDEFFVSIEAHGAIEIVNSAGELWTIGMSGPYYGAPLRFDTTQTWLQSSIGGSHFMRQASDGAWYAFGRGFYGAFGNGNGDDTYVPEAVGGDVSFQTIEASAHHNLAIADDGSLWGWGFTWSNQLGLPATDICQNCPNGGCSTWSCIKKPAQINASSWSSVAAGNLFGAGVQSDGTLWTWGQGLGSLASNPSGPPEQVGTDTDWVEVSALDRKVAIARKSDGTLWSWGNSDGDFEPALGLGHEAIEEDMVRVSVPTQIGTDSNWASMSVGHDHVLAIKSDGTLWGFGESPSGELGEFTNAISTPKQIGVRNDWAKAVAGDRVSVTLDNQGKVHVFGYDLFLRLNRDTEMSCGSFDCSAEILPLEIRR